LKGSTVGRTCGENLQNAKEGTIFRDLDFLELDRRINVGPQYVSEEEEERKRFVF
jgi:hypothetical protein